MKKPRRSCDLRGFSLLDSRLSDPAGIIKIPAKPAMKAEISFQILIGLRIDPLGI